MFFSKSMWVLIRKAYYRKRAYDYHIQALIKEVSSTIPWCFKKRKFVFVQENTNLYPVRISEKEVVWLRLYRYRKIYSKVIGYPIHKFGFFHKKTGWASRWAFKKRAMKKKFDKKNVKSAKKNKRKLKRMKRKERRGKL